MEDTEATPVEAAPEAEAPAVVPEESPKPAKAKAPRSKTPSASDELATLLEAGVQYAELELITDPSGVLVRVERIAQTP